MAVVQPLEVAVTATHPNGQNTSLRTELQGLTGIDVFRCYQCGKCSAGCPMADEMVHKPHMMLRLAQLDRRGRLLADGSMWLCLSCETCSTRCPNHAEPAHLIDGLREICWHTTGRVFELGLVAHYKLRSGAWLQDVRAVPGLIERQKLAFLPTTIKGVSEVRAIFAALDASSSARSQPAVGQPVPNTSPPATLAQAPLTGALRAQEPETTT
jgi:heterodisulfide reductase subunit C